MKSFMHIHTESDSETDDVADDASHADVTKPRPHMLSITTTNSTSDSAPAPVMLPGESADNTPRCQFGAATVAWRVSYYTLYCALNTLTTGRVALDIRSRTDDTI